MIFQRLNIEILKKIRVEEKHSNFRKIETSGFLKIIRNKFKKLSFSQNFHFRDMRQFITLFQFQFQKKIENCSSLNTIEQKKTQASISFRDQTPGEKKFQNQCTLEIAYLKIKANESNH